MSTRATYEFIDQLGASHTIYIHYDGHPKGAAEYFEDALNYPINAEHNSIKIPPNANEATIFLIANREYAELTESHSAHSDTEFQYTLTRIDDNLHISAFDVNADKIFFEGSINEFVEQFG